MSRAAHEQTFAKKTWFITLTYKPALRSAIMRQASLNDRKKPEHALVDASAGYVTKYFKRLRKAGFVFRYLCIPELHRDGFPHWHGLIHDQRGDLLWKDLSRFWCSNGFSVFEIVKDANAIRYVTKYVSKTMQGRIRASKGYGETEAERELEREAFRPAGEVSMPPKEAGNLTQTSNETVTKTIDLL